MYTRHPVECVHHWVFGTPKGQINIGTCKYCGERTEAVNYLDDRINWSKWTFNNIGEKKGERHG